MPRFFPTARASAHLPLHLNQSRAAAQRPAALRVLMLSKIKVSSKADSGGSVEWVALAESTRLEGAETANE